MSKLFISVIQFYRTFLSPLKPPTCRFYPTCSEYAIEAIRVHGAWYGSLLAIRRIAKCGPWHPGGSDPVPCKHSINSPHEEDSP